MIMHAEEFVLIPKRMFMSKQLLKSEIFDNPAYRKKAAQLTLMQRNMPSSEGSVEKADGVVQTEPVLTEREKDVEEPEKMDSISYDSEIDPVVTKKPETAPGTFESIMALVELKEKHKIQRAEIMLDLILQSKAVTIGEESWLLYINQEPTSVQVSKFLYDLQQPTKKIDQSEYSQILAVLPIAPELDPNTYAKQILQAYECEQEFFPTQQSPQSGSGNPKRATTGKKRQNQKDKQKRKGTEKMGSFLRLREKPRSNFIQKALLLLVGQRDFIQSKMSRAIGRSYLEAKPFFTKYPSVRLRFPRL